MLYTERAELILQQVQLQSIVKISDLVRELNVSVDTVRRDLKSMEQEGLIKCIRGGACLPDSLASMSGFSRREIIHEDEKREAARKALEYIGHGMTVALNAGTTNTILAQELMSRKDEITVVTNNLAAVNILMQHPTIHLIVIGGSVDLQEKSTYGPVCEQEFGTYFPDIAFLSINAVSDEDEFTDFRFSEIAIMQILARQSRKVIAVMDSSKLGKRSKKKALSADQVDKVLMDGGVPEEIQNQYKERGILIE